MDKRTGHRGVKIGEAGRQSPQEEKKGRGKQEVESLTEGKSAGSHD